MPDDAVRREAKRLAALVPPAPPVTPTSCVAVLAYSDQFDAARAELIAVCPVDAGAFRRATGGPRDDA